MKKLLVFLLSMVLLHLFPTVIAESSTFLVGRDLAPGTYTAELYASDESTIIGTASCCILRPIEGTYQHETIETKDMMLKAINPAWEQSIQIVGLEITDLNPSCEIVLLDGDRFIFSCSDSWNVRLVNMTGSEVEDQYPGAIDGVNLTEAINITLAAVDNYPELYPGLKSIDIKYSDVLPSIELLLHMEDGEIDKYEEVVHTILFTLNIACCKQNSVIKESLPYYHGGIYDEITVIVGVYDNSILYTDAGFNTYYILPGTFDILKFN